MRVAHRHCRNNGHNGQMARYTPEGAGGGRETIVSFGVALHAVSCVKKVILPRLGHKTYSSLFLLAFFDLRWQNLSSLKAERPSSE